MQNSFNNCGGSMIPSITGSGLSLGGTIGFPNFPEPQGYIKCTKTTGGWTGNCYYAYFECDHGNGFISYHIVKKCIAE